VLGLILKVKGEEIFMTIDNNTNSGHQKPPTLGQGGTEEGGGGVFTSKQRGGRGRSKARKLPTSWEHHRRRNRRSGEQRRGLIPTWEAGTTKGLLNAKRTKLIRRNLFP